MIQSSLRLQSDIVREGRQAVSITVRPQDKFEAGRQGDADSERDELLEARSLVSRQGTAYEYAFSMFFPKDFPIVPTRLVIAQWKQYCPEGREMCSNDSPVLALRYIGGVLSLTQDIDRKYIVLWQKKAEFRGRWLDVKVQTRFSPDESGFVKAWLNGDAIVDSHRRTANTEEKQTGYQQAGYFYFKMGLYRNVMQQPMTVYIDAYRKREIGQ